MDRVAAAQCSSWDAQPSVDRYQIHASSDNYDHVRTEHSTHTRFVSASRLHPSMWSAARASRLSRARERLWYGVVVVVPVVSTVCTIMIMICLPTTTTATIIIPREIMAKADNLLITKVLWKDQARTFHGASLHLARLCLISTRLIAPTVPQNSTTSRLHSRSLTQQWSWWYQLPPPSPPPPPSLPSNSSARCYVAKVLRELANNK